MVALCIVHAHILQCLECGVIGHKLGNRLLAHDMADMGDGVDHGAVAWVLQHVLDKAAIDLEVVHWQLLQVFEAGHAGAEIIQ